MSNDQHTNEQVKKGIKKVLVPVFFALLFIFVLAPLLGLIIQLLWNATLTPIFELTPISYWQAIGVFILAKFFFGFGGSSGNNKSKSYKKRRDGPPTRDDGFKAYWQSEGKQAWEDFQTQEVEEAPHEDQ